MISTSDRVLAIFLWRFTNSCK